MRKGFTTGSCAAAASKAACYMLLTGAKKEKISIETPAGIMFDADIVDIELEDGTNVTCSVVTIFDVNHKEYITTGSHVIARVSISDFEKVESIDKPQISIEGGFGVGRVTKPGLDQPVGNAAINHVPREMIEKEVLEVCQLLDFSGTLNIVISVPEGEELSNKTFNLRLGIVGGISILGTTGIVEPMSTKALIDTIKVELHQKTALGYKYAIVSPGNYGLKFMADTFDYDLDKMGLTETIRNRIYDLPIHLFLRILTYCILYNDDEMFDGVYKIMKYKIAIDKDDQFKQIASTDRHSMQEVKSLIAFMKNVSNRFDKKHVFELDKIEKMVKIKNY